MNPIFWSWTDSLNLVEIPSSNVLFKHDSSHEKVNDTIPKESTIKSSNSKCIPNSLCHLRNTLLSVIHHYCIGCICLHLSQNSYEGVSEKVGQYCRQNETVGRRVLNKLKPGNWEQRILKQQKTGPCEHIFERHFLENVNGWFVDLNKTKKYLDSLINYFA